MRVRKTSVYKKWIKGLRDSQARYRILIKDNGQEIVVLLCGGDKSTQQQDVAGAKQIAISPLEEEE